MARPGFMYEDGTVLTGTYNGKRVTIETKHGGYHYAGKTYPSLAAIAKKVGDRDGKWRQWIFPMNVGAGREPIEGFDGIVREELRAAIRDWLAQKLG